VNTVIVLVAQYLLFGLALLAGLAWLTLDRPRQVRLAAAGVLGLAVFGLGIWIAGSLHVDPGRSCRTRRSARCSRTPPTTASPPTTRPPGGS
jgi:hypothetical protein